MEFLVRIEFEAPAGTTPDALALKRADEAVRAQELARSGNLVRLWRPETLDGRWANIGIWHADDESDLRAILRTLPLFPWASIDVSPLFPHPNDPGSSLKPERRAP